MVYPGRVTWWGGGVISLTTVDNRKGCWGVSFVFSVCVCLYVQRGWGKVLIKYSGNVRLQNQTFH